MSNLILIESDVTSQNRSFHMFRHYSKKMLVRYSVISNVEVITGIPVDYPRKHFFIKEIFEPKQLTKSTTGSKNIKLKK